MAALNEGMKAPDFALPLVGGGEFSLQAALAKSAVVLVFFKISCPVCQYAAPFYDRLAQRMKSVGIPVIGVSQDDAESTKQFMQRFGANFPVAIDGKGYPVSAAYGLTNVQTICEIAQDGTVTTSSVSWARDEVAAVYEK